MNPIRYDADGRVAEWIGTSLDIDDIIRDQERLIEATQLLQLTQEAAEAGSFEWCITDGTTRLSRDSRRLLGLPEDGPDTVPQDVFGARVDRRDLERVRSAGRAAIRAGAPYRAEFRVPARDRAACAGSMAVGRPRPRTPETGAERILGLNIDITERKARRGARSSARRRCCARARERLAFARSRPPTTASGTGTFPRATAGSAIAGASMLGYARTEIDPHVSGWERLIHPDDRAAVDAALAAPFRRCAPPSTSASTGCATRTAPGAGSLDRGKVVARDPEGRPLRAVGHPHRHHRRARRPSGRCRAHGPATTRLTDLPNRTLLPRADRCGPRQPGRRDTGRERGAAVPRPRPLQDGQRHALATPVGRRIAARHTPGGSAGQIRHGDVHGPARRRPNSPCSRSARASRTRTQTRWRGRLIGALSIRRSPSGAERGHCPSG